MRSHHERDDWGLNEAVADATTTEPPLVVAIAATKTSTFSLLRLIESTNACASSRSSRTFFSFAARALPGLLHLLCRLFDFLNLILQGHPHFLDGIL